ncbi:MAG: hypothetical protein V3R85_12910 [Alphaproteobacteria bacterium]
MRVVNTAKVKWHRNMAHIRGGGGLRAKQLLKGKTGAPENYVFNVSHSDGDYSTPRHRHNFDQVRFALEGDMRISPNQVVREGQIGYFPEGTTYGPYADGGKARTIMIVQFGGASGQGYMDNAQQRAAKEKLLKEGAFKDGMFVRARGTGPRRTDAYRAVWERCFGRRLELPKPRYEKPVIVDPRNFEWRATRRRGVEKKSLGIFTERQTRLEMVRIEAGKSWASRAERALSLFFVVDGKGTCDGQFIGKRSGAETGPGESATFTAKTEVTLFCLVMPLIEKSALSQAA